MVGNPVGPECRRDVDLDHDKVRAIVHRQLLNVFVSNADFICRIEIRRESGQTQRWEKRVLDRPEQRTGCFSQSGKDHLDAHKQTLIESTLYCKEIYYRIC